jgi:hypothetical protein
LTARRFTFLTEANRNKLKRKNFKKPKKKQSLIIMSRRALANGGSSKPIVGTRSPEERALPTSDTYELGT